MSPMIAISTPPPTPPDAIEPMIEPMSRLPLVAAAARLGAIKPINWPPTPPPTIPAIEFPTFRD